MTHTGALGAWRPIAPEHLRPWPPGRATNVEQVGTAENGIGEDSEDSRC